MKNTILIFTSMLLLLTSFHFKKTSKQGIEVNAVISSDGANILRIGVPNPISVAISGVPIENTKVSIDKGILVPTSRLGHYHVRVFAEGRVTISLEGRDRQGKVVKSSRVFRAKNLLKSAPGLGNKSGGLIGVGEMRAQRGIIAPVLNFDGDARFNVLGFKMMYVAKNEDAVTVENRGASFSAEAMALIRKAAVGDSYFFTDIEIQQVDGTVKQLDQEMSFKIK